MVGKPLLPRGDVHDGRHLHAGGHPPIVESAVVAGAEGGAAIDAGLPGPFRRRIRLLPGEAGDVVPDGPVARIRVALVIGDRGGAAGPGLGILQQGHLCDPQADSTQGRGRATGPPRCSAGASRPRAARAAGACRRAATAGRRAAAAVGPPAPPAPPADEPVAPPLLDVVSPPRQSRHLGGDCRSIGPARAAAGRGHHIAGAAGREQDDRPAHHACHRDWLHATKVPVPGGPSVLSRGD